ncbi:MAG TPA: hypothetical protein VGA08_00720 [Candidatus Saccharimonadales bacterium]
MTVLAWAVFNHDQAYAQGAFSVTNRMPEPNNFVPGASPSGNGGGDVWMLVANYGAGNGLDAPSSRVRIYFPPSIIGPQTVRLLHPDVCSGAIGSGDIDSDVYAPTVFNVYKVSGNDVTDTATLLDSYSSRDWGQVGNAQCQPVDLTFPRNQLEQINTGGKKAYDGYYVVELRVDTAGVGGVNAFKVRAPGAEAIGTRDNGNAKFAFQDRNGTNDTLTDFNLGFAPDCDVTDPVDVRLEWFDDDRAGINGATIQNNSNYRMEVRELRRSDGSVNQTWFMDYSGTNNFNATSGWLGNGIPGSPNGWAEITVQKGFVYEWTWYNVKKTNGIQFRLPYDSINYRILCPVSGAWDYDIQLRGVNSSSVLFPGDRFTVDSEVINNGEISGDRYEHRVQVSGGNNWRATAQNILRIVSRSQPSASSIDNTTMGAVWDQSGLDPGQSRIRGVTYEVNSNARPGDEVCFIGIVRPAGGPPGSATEDNTDNTTDDEDGPAWIFDDVCILIKEAPYFRIANNDIWSGGVFANANRTNPASDPLDCSGVTTMGQAGIRGFEHGGVGAYGDLAAMSLGDINQFGTLGNPTGTALTFANTGPLGNLGASPLCIYDLFNYLDKSDSLTQTAPNAYTSVPPTGQYFINKSDPNSNFKLGRNSGWTINGRTTIIISGDVQIRGNIEYNQSGFSSNNGSISGPAFALIVRGNIYIERDVTRLDGLYVSLFDETVPPSGGGGFIHTCVEVSGAEINTLSTGLCNNRLEIRGAVIAKQLILNRTRQGVLRGVLRTGHAEIFRFGPELYANPPLLLGDPNALETQSVRDLPPVF